MLPNSSANRLASSASSGSWGGISSGKPRSYNGTTSDEESEPDDGGVVIMDKHLQEHGDEKKKEDVGRVSTPGSNYLKMFLPPGPTSSSSNHQALSADASKPVTTQHNQHLKPPMADYDHDTSSDEDRSHRIPGAFVWTPTRPRFKKLHPH